MGRMRIWFLVLLLPLTSGFPLLAQDQPAAGQPNAPQVSPEQPVLVTAGKPMVLPFQCTQEDVGSAGFSCSEEAPCPVYLELGAAASTGNKFFVAGNIHSHAVK